MGASYFVPYAEAWGDTALAREAFEGVRNVQSGQFPSFRLEYPCHAPDGDQRWFVMQVLPLLGKAGTVLVSHTNISARKQAEEALQKSETSLRAIFENSLESFVVIDLSRKIQAFNRIANERARAVFGKGLQPGDSIYDCVLPQDRERFDQDFQRALAGEWCRVEKPFQAGAAEHWFEFHYAPVRAAGGPVTGVFFSTLDVTARKQAEEALRESEEWFRRVFDQAPIGAAMVSLDFHFTRVNAAFCRLLGYSAEELLRLTFPEITHLDDLAQDRVEVDRLRRGEIDQYTTDKRYLCKDGRVVWGHLSLQPVCDAVGAVVCFLPMVEDITERIRAEEARRASEERFRKLFEGHSAVKLVMEPDTGNILDANEAASNFYGWPIEDLKQMRIQQINTLSAEAVKSHMEQASASPGTRFEFRHRRADGSIREVEVFSNRIEVAGKAFLYSIIHDISDRKRSEAALQESEARFHSLFEYSPISLWEEDFSAVKAWLEDLRQQGVADFERHFASHPEAVDEGIRRLKVLDVNQAALKLYGAQSKSELLNSAGQVFGPETRLIIAEELAAIARGEREFENMGVNHKLTGERMDVVLRWFIPAAHEQTLSRVIVSVTDITQRKQAEDALRQLNAELEQRVDARTADLNATNRHLVTALRIKDEFLAAMSHELRTPLTAILGLTELLQMQVIGPLTEKQGQYVQLIHQSGEHLLALITDVLDLAKLAAGQTSLELGPVNIAEVCQAPLQLVKPQADKKQIAVSLTLDPSVPCLQADARRLKKILVNLLGNAVKFTPAGGQVGLAVSGDKKQRVIEFTVWDTGLGIAAEDLPRLFQDFAQLDARLARNYEGTGLGLAMVRRLAELHGGQVKAESDGLGKGSRFTVSLPWSEA